MADRFNTISGPQDRHWFVAINDVDVGPLDLNEVVARWNTGELNAASLVWKPGMLNWQPVGEIPELSHLTRQPERAAAPAIPEIRWDTSEALSLTALVAQELDATSPTTTVSAPAGAFAAEEAALAGLPDITALGFQASGPRSSWEAGWAPPAPAFGGSFVAPTPWQAPPSDYRRRLQVAALIGAGFMVLTAGLIVALAELLRAPAPPPSAVLGELPPAAIAAAPAAAEPALQPVAAPAPPPAPVESEPPTAPRAEPVKREPVASRPTRRPPKPRPAAAEASGAALTREDILAGIKKNAPSLMSCLKAARSAGEISPGPIKLVLDWNIEPDGGVSGGKLKGPPRLLGTSLRACFAAKMTQWQFPASSRTSTVRNFGLPVTIR